MNILGLKSGNQAPPLIPIYICDITVSSNLYFLKVSPQLFQIFSASSCALCHHVLSFSKQITLPCTSWNLPGRNSSYISHLPPTLSLLSYHNG